MIAAPFNSNPLVSVITIVYNGQSIIESTIRSIIDQTYKNVEYIIVDGASTDGTKDIIDKYVEDISKLISEKDCGIFDAMNKGLKLATGDWIIFMNAGDMFYNKEVLASIFNNKLVSDYDMIYGDVCLFNDKEMYYFKSKTNSIKINLNAVCHQSVFIKLASHPPFNLDYNLSADHDIIYDFIKHKKVLYLNTTISKILIGGVSSDLKKTRNQKLKISLRKGKRADIAVSLLFYTYASIKDYTKQFLLRFFPKALFVKLRAIKNKMEQF